MFIEPVRQKLNTMLFLAVFAFSIANVSHASVFNIEIDTTALSGTVSQLAFDLVDGDGVINNDIIISNFFTDGTLGAASSSGGVTGALPGTIILSDADFFNELLQTVTLGSSISFSLDLTENFAGGLADQFSFFMLDDAGFFPLFQTSDPLFSDALFAIDITGTPSAGLDLFNPTSNPAPTFNVQAAAITTVPEPFSLVLLIMGLIALITSRQQRNSAQQHG